MDRRLFVTGGAGYVGGRLLQRLEATKLPITCLVRRPGALHAGRSERLEVVTGDLLQPETYAAALPRCDTVLHLAGLTGKASSSEMFRINRDGTRRLLEACRPNGVRNFLFVSSIAARWNAAHYPYAEAKRQAEAAVAGSGLRFTIIRPTPVFGPRSAIWNSLSRLARLSISPIFGHGRTLLQPIHVEDLAECLVDLVADDRFAGETFEVGGPEAISIEGLMRRMRQAYGRRPDRIVHLPLGVIQGVLAFFEPWFLGLLPFTAGQLSTFAHDGSIMPSAFVRARQARMKSVADMIAEAVAAEKDIT